jgi:hypothetical protein
MTTTTAPSAPKLIHVARLLAPGPGRPHLFLRKLESNRFTWFEESSTEEIETSVTAQHIEEALRLAVRHWKHQGIRFLMCGFRYTLPERDEHGMNALFHQMCASYRSMNGVYYDEELGNNCFVQNASTEALEMMNQLEGSKTS